jgi:hypothetical protein
MVFSATFNNISVIVVAVIFIVEKTNDPFHWKLFSPWYFDEIAELALNNNHSLTTLSYVAKNKHKTNYEIWGGSP